MKRHPTDLVSLVPGAIAVVVAVAALTDRLTLDLLATEWLWPAVLIVLGVLVLGSAGIGRRPASAGRGAATAGRGAEPHGPDATVGDGADGEESLLDDAPGDRDGHGRHDPDDRHGPSEQA